MLYIKTMERTQVYLTKELKQKIKLTALVEEKPEAEVIRETLEKGFEGPRKGKKYNAGKGLLKLATLGKKWGLKGPTDLSTNLDDYLYGDK